MKFEFSEWRAPTYTPMATGLLGHVVIWVCHFGILPIVVPPILYILFVFISTNYLSLSLSLSLALSRSLSPSLSLSLSLYIYIYIYILYICVYVYITTVSLYIMYTPTCFDISVSSTGSFTLCLAKLHKFLKLKLLKKLHEDEVEM